MRLDTIVGERTLRVEVRRTDRRYSVILDGTRLDIDLVEGPGHMASLLVDGCSHELGVEARADGYRVHFPGDTITVVLAAATREGATRTRRPQGPERVTAPMPGRVVRVLADEGCEVEAGQGLVVVEAMKMENELRAPRAGRVREVAVREGQAVEAGALLVVVG